MPSPSASRSKESVSNSKDVYRKLLRKKLEKSPLVRYRSEPDEKMLDQHIDLGNADYRKQRAEEVALAYLLLRELGNSKDCDTTDMANLVNLLKTSLQKGSSIRDIISQYRNIFKAIEEDFACQLLTEKAEEILWKYLLWPLTQDGATRRDARGTQARNGTDGLSVESLSLHHSQDSSNQSLSQTASRGSEESCLDTLYKRIRTASILRAMSPPERHEGKNRRNRVEQFQKRVEQAATKEASKLCHTMNMSDTDDPPPIPDGTSGHFFSDTAQTCSTTG